MEYALVNILMTADESANLHMMHNAHNAHPATTAVPLPKTRVCIR